jgi:hypothetical protein
LPLRRLPLGRTRSTSHPDTRRHPLQSWTQEQLTERVRYTEEMLIKTLAAIKKTAAG